MTLETMDRPTSLSHRNTVDPRKLFEFHEDIRSAMIVDRIGNVVDFASRTSKPVDPLFVRDIGSKWTAFYGGMLRGSEEVFGALKWVHIRYGRLHLYCWLVDGGYLVFTSRSQLEDDLITKMGTSRVARAKNSDQWVGGDATD